MKKVSFATVVTGALRVNHLLPKVLKSAYVNCVDKDCNTASDRSLQFDGNKHFL